jgi:hypothetical protein
VRQRGWNDFKIVVAPTTQVQATVRGEEQEREAAKAFQDVGVSGWAKAEGLA